MDVIKEMFNQITDGIMGLFTNVGKEVSKNKDFFKKILIIIIPIILTILLIHLVITSIRNSNCTDVRKKIGDNVDAYLMTTNGYPTINGDYVTVDLVNVDKVKFKEEICEGKVKVTKVNDEYIKTFYLENCNYCKTGEFGKERDKYNSKVSNVEVMVYFNYYTVSNNNSRWSDYIEYEEISKEVDEEYGIMLPLDEKDLPNISDEAIITGILKEDKVFYRYRTKTWLWYKVNNNNYSDFSSEQPSGYANKDKRTETRTEYTDWSIDYPEEKEYRSIFNKTGYRWYKKDEDGNVVYWNNGNFYPEEPEEGYKKENDSKITMYRYFDKMWRWYNGEARGYSSNLSSKAPTKQYLYKDEQTVSYSDWSKYYTYSTITSENSSYREEATNLHSRYLIKYKIRSKAVLDKHLEREEFEQYLGRSLEEMTNDETIDLDIVFKYRY